MSKPSKTPKYDALEPEEKLAVHHHIEKNRKEEIKKGNRHAQTDEWTQNSKERIADYPKETLAKLKEARAHEQASGLPRDITPKPSKTPKYDALEPEEKLAVHHHIEKNRKEEINKGNRHAQTDEWAQNSKERIAGYSKERLAELKETRAHEQASGLSRDITPEKSIPLKTNVHHKDSGIHR